MRIIEVRLYSHPEWANFSDFVQKWKGAIAAATIKVAFNYKGIHTLTIFRSINYRPQTENRWRTDNDLTFVGIFSKQIETVVWTDPFVTFRVAGYEFVVNICWWCHK